MTKSKSRRTERAQPEEAGPGEVEDAWPSPYICLASWALRWSGQTEHCDSSRPRGRDLAPCPLVKRETEFLKGIESQTWN